MGRPKVYAHIVKIGHKPIDIAFSNLSDMRIYDNKMGYLNIDIPFFGTIDLYTYRNMDSIMMRGILNKVNDIIQKLASMDTEVYIDFIEDTESHVQVFYMQAKMSSVKFNWNSERSSDGFEQILAIKEDRIELAQW